MMTFDRIDWKRGMEIMPETFLYADGYHDSVSRLNRQLLVPFAYGLVPLHDFTLKYTIIDHKLTIDKISCTIMDGEGNVLHITKGISLPLPKEVQGTFYLAVSCGEEDHIEKNGVPMLEQGYKFQIINLLNPCSPFLFPLLKLHAENGDWEVVDFIPPCCVVSAHSDLSNLSNQCRQCLGKILDLVEKKGDKDACYQIGYLIIEMSNSSRYDTPAMLISYLKKAVFILKSNHLFDGSDDELLDRAGEFVQLEYNPNALFETIQEALSYLHAALAFLQQTKSEPVPVVEKPKPEPEEEEFTYML